MGRFRWYGGWLRRCGAVRRGLALVILVLIIWGCAAVYGNLRQMLGRYSETQCRSLVTQIVSEALAETTPSESFSSTTENDAGQVIQLNAPAINAYRAAFSLCLGEKLRTLQQEKLSVALGTAIDSAIFFEHGPRINIRFVPMGSAVIDIASTVKSAGINQTLYRVVLNVQVCVTVILPGKAHAVTCEQQVTLEENLVTGQVPDFYAAVDEIGQS